MLVDVYEKDLRFVRPGLTIAMETPAYPGEKFKATIDFINKIVDDASRTIKVRARVDNPDGRLMPAMYATVDVYGGDDARAILIPLTALYTEGDADWVFVRLPNGHYVRRKVTVGLHLKDHAVIESGLSAGDTVVIDGALLLRAEESAG
jgi:cobalt-zinc-cadmium efflux system membrane fusion protein